jgi:hypothetical protein
VGFFLVGGGLGEGFTWEDLSIEGFFMKGVPDFPALFKKRSEIKLKKNVSSTESKEEHEKLY